MDEEKKELNIIEQLKIVQEQMSKISEEYPDILIIAVPKDATVKELLKGVL